MRISSWLAEWDKADSPAHRTALWSRLETVWMRSLKYDNTTASFIDIDAPVFNKFSASITKARVLTGTLIHNDSPEGFDASLGAEILKSCAKIPEALRKRSSIQALQVDLESLKSDQAENFLKCLQHLESALPESVRLSVALHAKDSDPGSYDGSHFQDWPALARLRRTDFVLMAYNYSWETSAPGPVAPLQWVDKVVAHALRHFPKDRIIVALPYYGYEWHRNPPAKDGDPASTPAWSGRVVEPGEFKTLVQRFEQLHKVKAPLSGDSGGLLQTEKHAFSWDDARSLAMKIKHINRKYGLKRFAYWKSGQEDPQFAAAIGKML